MTEPPRRIRKRHALLVLFSLATLSLSAWINLPVITQLFRKSALRVAMLPSTPPVTPGARVLILSPHPDDETLCCAGLIQQVQAAGGQVYVAWVTAGDGFEFDAALTERVLRPRPRNMRELGNKRAAEAVKAVSVLDIPKNRTFMLGYPDGGLRGVMNAAPDAPFTSRRTGASAVYVDGALTPASLFTRQALETDLNLVLNQVKPELVLAPAPQDFHHDHHVVSLLAQQLMKERDQEGRLRYWVVHGGLEWPIPKGLHAGTALTVPPRATRLDWQRLDLTPQQEQQKLNAINAYHTQTEIMGRFLHAFVRKNELYTEQVTPP